MQRFGVKFRHIVYATEKEVPNGLLYSYVSIIDVHRLNFCPLVFFWGARKYIPRTNFRIFSFGRYSSLMFRSTYVKYSFSSRIFHRVCNYAGKTDFDTREKL